MNYKSLSTSEVFNVVVYSIKQPSVKYGSNSIKLFENVIFVIVD